MTKLSDVLRALGRPVAYFPALCRVTGGVAETLLICQLGYWNGKQDDPDGWIAKTQVQIEEETGLTRREQETARRNLKAKGLLEWKRRGNPARLFYLVDFEALNEAWEQVADGPDSQTRLAESAIDESAKPPNTNGGKRHPLPYTETTTETTNRDFASLWDSYPTRNGAKGSKQAALAIWKKLKPEDRAAALAMLPDYARSMNGYPRDAERYLKHKLWEGIVPAEIGSNGTGDKPYQNPPDPEGYKEGVLR